MFASEATVSQTLLLCLLLILSLWNRLLSINSTFTPSINHQPIKQVLSPPTSLLIYLSLLPLSLLLRPSVYLSYSITPNTFSFHPIFVIIFCLYRTSRLSSPPRSITSCCSYPLFSPYIASIFDKPAFTWIPTTATLSTPPTLFLNFIQSSSLFFIFFFSTCLSFRAPPLNTDYRTISFPLYSPLFVCYTFRTHSLTHWHAHNSASYLFLLSLSLSHTDLFFL